MGARIPDDELICTALRAYWEDLDRYRGWLETRSVDKWVALPGLETAVQEVRDEAQQYRDLWSRLMTERLERQKAVVAEVTP